MLFEATGGHAGIENGQLSEVLQQNDALADMMRSQGLQSEQWLRQMQALASKTGVTFANVYSPKPEAMDILAFDEFVVMHIHYYGLHEESGEHGGPGHIGLTGEPGRNNGTEDHIDGGDGEDGEDVSSVRLVHTRTRKNKNNIVCSACFFAFTSLTTLTHMRLFLRVLLLVLLVI
jgi:hypothetical protein